MHTFITEELYLEQVASFIGTSLHETRFWISANEVYDEKTNAKLVNGTLFTNKHTQSSI